MRSLEMSQKTDDFCWKGSRVVGLASRKVAEKRYAPVRKVCDYKLWVRCEASRPGNVAFSGSVSDWCRCLSGMGWEADCQFSSKRSLLIPEISARKS